MNATPKLILVATDYSDPAGAALETGLDLARVGGGELHVVHVFTYPTPPLAPYDVALPSAYLEETRLQAEKQMQELGDDLSEKGIAVQTHVLSTPTVEGITGLARELGADLIVVGTHGHTGLKHALLGSVAERVVRHADCDVLVARPRREAADA